MLTRLFGGHSTGSVSNLCYRVWTRMPLADWEEAKRVGEIRGTIAHYTQPEFGPAYDWLKKQLKKRLGDGYEGGCPIISWVSPMPTKDDATYFGEGVPTVRVECMIPKSHTVLFSKDGWALVKAKWYVPLVEADSELFDRITRDINRFEECPPGMQEAIVDSWERIFDLEAIKAGGIFNAERVYAASECISMTEVVTTRRGKPVVEEFTTIG